jgi:hypothetical protein
LLLPNQGTLKKGEAPGCTAAFAPPVLLPIAKKRQKHRQSMGGVASPKEKKEKILI